MKGKPFILILFATTLFFASCGNKNQNSTDDAAADTSMVQEDLQQEEINEMSEVINGVSACLDSIQIQENMIFKDNEGATDKQKMLTRLSAFKDLLARKQAQINSLMEKNKKMSESDKKTIQNLQKMVSYLEQQLNEKTENIAKLQESLQKKDAKIDEFRYNMKQLSDESDYLKEQNYQQDKQINTVYYVVASRKELKELGIKDHYFGNKVNSDNIDKSKFKKSSKKSLKTIVIDSRHPRILTNNPASSYTLTKNDDRTTTLTITDANKFWSISPYLIIQE